MWLGFGIVLKSEADFVLHRVSDRCLADHLVIDGEKIFFLKFKDLLIASVLGRHAADEK